MLSTHEILNTGFIYSSFAFGMSVIMVLIKQLYYREKSFLGKFDIIFFNIVTTIAAWLYTASIFEILLILLFSAPFYLLAYRKLKNFYVSGKLLLTTNLLFLIFSLFWGITFIISAETALTTKILLFTSYPFILLSFFIGLVTSFEQWEVICRRDWQRPRDIKPYTRSDFNPKVCIQVPTYSEPPELVIQTLNAITKLKYDNYEVIVIDNNTKDRSLWEPVEKYCKKLGSKFRFFHAENIKGAKAGALNYVMKYVSEHTDIIAIMDSDYQPEKNFINDLIAYFEDPKVGFVQTPHDYREWGNSLYQRACYWEYKYFFETTMPSLNERDAALTVGTMCLIRKKALIEAGGWAEWCCTEDSELSIRIHALGYASVYVKDTFGRGLIPETFEGYKKQRFRWTYGPVQELKKHFRLYLPGRFSTPSFLTTKQKIHHLNHGLGYLNIGLGFILTPIYILTLVSIYFHQDVINFPSSVFYACFIYLTGVVVLKLLVYKKIMNCSFIDTLVAFIANNSLNHTYVTASLMCLVTREIPWMRTNKFKSLPLGLNALGNVQTEILMGVIFITVPLLAYILIPASGLNLVLLVTLMFKSMEYFSAPALALLSEYDLIHKNRSDTMIKSQVMGEALLSDKKNY